MYRLNEKKSVIPPLVSGAMADGDAANFYFDGPVHICIASNIHATTDFRILVNTNPTAAPSVGEASLTAFEERIAPGQSLDLCRDGMRSIRNLSVYSNGVAVQGDLLIAGVSL